MTTTDIERGLIARYAWRVLSRDDLPARAVTRVVYWLNERVESMSLPIPKDISETITGMYSTGFKLAEFEVPYKHCRAELLESLDRLASESPRPEPLATNVECLIGALGVPRPEAALKLVGLVACASRYEQIQVFSNMIVEVGGPLPRAVALLIGEAPRMVEEMLAPSAELVSSGLLQLREGEWLGGYNARYAVPHRINSCLDRTFRDFAEMRNTLLGPPLASPVGMDDYAHVAEDRDLVRNVLQGAAAVSEPGVNILLYGPPGSGKTELAKVAATAAGLTLFAAGEEHAHEREFDRTARLGDLVFSVRLLAGEKNVALLFDELEDVAVQLIQRGGSKVYLNRLLEHNQVPIIWTSNELSNIDPALLRRMTLAVEIKRPPAAQRKRIIERLLERNSLAVEEAEVELLAQRLDATPAILENAIRAARLAGGGARTIEHAARGVMRAVSGVAARRLVAIPSFDPLLTTASRDLIGLADQLVGGKARTFSLCLYGPPGTGKSAFARYLAGRLGLEIVQKRASDILGMFVGQSEKNIASAFEDAREAGAFLVFDEADSLLLDRRDAVRSWEISQVNEMLTWMEEHPLPVCFTTNLMDRIDEASLRRFTFNVRFDFLDRGGLERAWKVFFGLDVPPAALLALTNLTPGDFAKARKQSEVLGIAGRPEEVAALLDEISRGKPGAGGQLGFMN